LREIQQGAHAISEDSKSVRNFISGIDESADAVAAVRSLVDAAQTAPKNDFDACMEEFKMLNIQARGDAALQLGAYTCAHSHLSLTCCSIWASTFCTRGCACSERGFRSRERAAHAPPDRIVATRQGIG
jgi:hypothetical protein